VELRRPDREVLTAMVGSITRRLLWPCLIVAAATGAGSGPAIAAASRSYRSPGYRWNHKLPKVAPVVPGHLVKLGDGAYPRVLVDAAGTGQIAYATIPDGAPSTIRDCVLLRGQTSCTANSALVPAEAGDPKYNIDDDGPTPLVVGNELLMLDHRYPNPETLPDGTSGYPTFLWTSEDGGKTFTGPGVIGNLAVSGNAIVFGGAQPQIGVISDDMTGGTFFQTTPAGAYTSTRLQLGDQGPDEAYDGRLALDGNTPVAEFQDLSDHIFIREYKGVGDINSSANWSVAEINGQGYSRLVGGPSGVWLLYQKTYSGPLFVQRIVNGAPLGAASQVTPNSSFTHANYAITEGADGRLTVGWFTSSPTSLYVATSLDGSHWSAPQVIAQKLSDPSDLAIGAAGDGGGFAAFQEPEPGGASNSQIDVAAFGTSVANGLKGLGDLNGDGLGGLGGDPLGYTSCTDVHFGDIDALAETGCFLRDPSNPNGGAAITQGEIRLNGLEIIPDAGVEIVIDPRKHTINTTGDVRVVLRAPVIGDITLYHGSLNVSLSGSLADAGQTLFDFSTSTASSLKGFPFDTSIDVKIEHDSVVIPVSLKLPPYMGGVTGSATLIANNASGLQLSSLHIGVPDLVLGALEVKNLNIDYTAMGDQWSGSATLNIPAGSPYFGIAVSVRFDNGDFTMGSFNVTVPFPGIPIFTDTYLNGFGGGFDIHPASRRFFGSVSIGAIPLDPPNYTIGVTGTVAITFINGGPVVVEVDGQGSVHGFQVANAKLLFQSNGYFEVDGNVDINLSVAELKAGLKAFVDLPAKEFSANVTGELLVGGYDIVSAQAVVSSLGVAACGSAFDVNAGFSYPWGGSPSVSIGLGGCDISAYVAKPVSVASATRAGAGRRPAAVAAVKTVAAAPYEDLAVAGQGGPPSVILHGPQGQTLTPVKLAAGSASAPAVAVPVAANDTTYVMVTKPGNGTWTVSAAPGSTPITAVSVARGYTPPKIRATVGGHGDARVLHYSTTVRPGLSVSFAERGHGSYRVLGRAKRAHGTLRFVPSPGQAGKRTIYAIVTEDGVARESLSVASYEAPKPVTPASVRGLRVHRQRRAFSVTYGTATGASYYRVQIVASDGRHLLYVVHTRGRTHTLKLPVIGYKDHLTVSVTGVSSLGRLGHTVRARA
jgi:hypothetical protein